MKRLLFFLPVAALIGFAALFFAGLHHDKAQIVSRAGKAVPEFSLPLLEGKGQLRVSDLKGRWKALNFLASWCVPCVAEHAVLLKAPKEIRLIGISYKDKPEAAAAFFKKHGDPFALVALDREGRAGIEWGVTGVPETFLISPDGLIIRHHAGPITEKFFDEALRDYVR